MKTAQLPSEPEPLSAPRSRLHEQVFDRLRDDLMMGRFAPGEKLPLRGLAQRMGTSLMPVRDALQRLESLGVLVSSPGRTMLVPVLSTQEQADLIRLRILLESETAATAAELRTEAQLARLAEGCVAIRRHAETGDLEGYLEANHRFHMGLAEASRISFVAALLDPLWMRVGPIVRRSTPDQANMLRSVGYHDRVLVAVVHRDAEAARLGIVADILDGQMAA